MKVKCDYCDSNVEADGLLSCPCCTAPLGEAVRRAEEQAKQEALEAEERARQAALEAQQAELEAQKEIQAEQTKQTIASIVSGVLFSGLMSGGNRPTYQKTTVVHRPPQPGPMPGGFGQGHPTPPPAYNKPSSPAPVQKPASGPSYKPGNAGNKVPAGKPVQNSPLKPKPGAGQKTSYSGPGFGGSGHGPGGHGPGGHGPGSSGGSNKGRR